MHNRKGLCFEMKRYPISGWILIIFVKNNVFVLLDDMDIIENLSIFFCSEVYSPLFLHKYIHM